MINQPLLPHQPIGIFDSGVGGLSVFRAIREELPHEGLLYLGDQKHIPYGPRSKQEIRDFAIGITHFLLEQGAKLIVVACNTASAAALYDLRELFPSIPIVGMEPAVKPAAKTTHTGKIGVIATPTTFKGDLYASVVARFGQDIRIFQNTCPGLVEQIEGGQIQSPATRSILEQSLSPMLAEGVDTIVLGCTHYPFVIPQIREIAGSEVCLIDPAPAIARQVRRQLIARNLLNTQDAKGNMLFFTSGAADVLAEQLEYLLGIKGIIKEIAWQKDKTLTLKP